MDLFWKVREALGEKPVIAEDLGYVTDSVRDLVRDSGFPGMKVLEFAFDSRDSGCANDYLPHNYPVNSVAYTGTHDNETLAGWWGSISKDEQKLTREYLCDTYTPEAELNKSLISLIMRSAAKWCVIPMQDYLGLDNKVPYEYTVNGRNELEMENPQESIICEITERDLYSDIALRKNELDGRSGRNSGDRKIE